LRSLAAVVAVVTTRATTASVPLVRAVVSGLVVLAPKTLAVQLQT